MHAPRSQERPRRPPPRRPPGPRRPAPPPTWLRWGSLPGRSGVWIIACGAVLGLVATIVSGREPGALLGAFLIAATLIAALAVRASAVHLIIPAPALAYLVAGMIAGLVHDRGTLASRTGLEVDALQWIAGGFLAMTAATALAIAFTVARRARARRGPSDRTKHPAMM